MAKHTNRISGKILSWRRLLTVRHFVCKISHKNYINFYISISQSERKLDRPMPGPFPAYPIFIGK